MPDSQEQLRQLHATLGKMELALGSIKEAIVWADSGGLIQWCNHAFDRMAGQSHIRILGQSLSALLPLVRETGQGPHPVQVLMDGTPQVHGTYTLKQNGAHLFLEIWGSRVPAGAVGDLLILSMTDVTELVLSQRALEQAKQNLELRVARRTQALEEVSNQYKSILSGAVDAIITIDASGTIRSFNPAAVKMFGFREDEAVGQNVSLIIPMPVRQDHDRYIQRYLATGEKKIIGTGREVLGLCRDGQQIPLYLGVSEVRFKDRVIFTGVLRDISDQKAAEAELERARDEAQAANRAKSQFLANMSHEIRTPLNAVLGFSELLIPLVEKGRARQYLDAIMSSGRGLLAIINDILDLSKIEAGKLDLVYDRVDMAVLMEEVRQTFARDAGEKGLEINVALGPGIGGGADGQGPGFWLDEMRVRQILLNLVGNAVKFTVQGEIILGAAYDDGVLKIRVKDTGIGIPENRQEEIFRAFEQQNTATARDFGGTGLGLTISRSLVGMMNGTLTLESREGQGSEFTVTLKDVALARTGPAKARKTVSVSSLQSRARILVVDDMASNRDLIREMLAGTGMSVAEAHDGHQALATLRDVLPDLVLLDIRMPGMDGHQVLKAMKSTPEFAQIPVICMTASVGEAEQGAWKENGFQGLVTKPLSKKVLFSELKRFLPGTGTEGLSKNEVPGQRPESEEVPVMDPAGLCQALKDLGPPPEGKGVLEIEAIERFALGLARTARKFGAMALERQALTAAEAAGQFDIAGVRTALDALEKTWSRLTSVP